MFVTYRLWNIHNWFSHPFSYEFSFPYPKNGIIRPCRRLLNFYENNITSKIGFALGPAKMNKTYTSISERELQCKPKNTSGSGRATVPCPPSLENSPSRASRSTARRRTAGTTTTAGTDNRIRRSAWSLDRNHWPRLRVEQGGGEGGRGERFTDAWISSRQYRLLLLLLLLCTSARRTREKRTMRSAPLRKPSKRNVRLVLIAFRLSAGEPCSRYTR